MARLAAPRHCLSPPFVDADIWSVSCKPANQSGLSQRSAHKLNRPVPRGFETMTFAPWTAIRPRQSQAYQTRDVFCMSKTAFIPSVPAASEDDFDISTTSRLVGYRRFFGVLKVVRTTDGRVLFPFDGAPELGPYPTSSKRSPRHRSTASTSSRATSRGRSCQTHKRHVWHRCRAVHGRGCINESCNKKRRLAGAFCWMRYSDRPATLPHPHSTVTDFARFRGLSTSVPRAQAV